MGDYVIEPSPGVLALRGEFDLGNAEELRAALATARGTGDRIDVHLDGLTFMDSSALNELIRPIQDGCELTLHGCPPLVRRLLTVTGVESVLKIVD